MATIGFQAEGADRVIDVSIAGSDTQGRARVGAFEAEFEAGSIRPGSGWLRMNGRSMPYHAARVGEALHVWLDGRVYAFRLQDGAARRAGGAAALGVLKDLAAPMPGTIIAIHVARSERFEAHQPLVTMESMKMEMTLSAPAPGRVKEVLGAVGQLVEMNAILLRLERDDA